MPKPILSNDLGTQISKLTGCGFTRIGNLNFNFPYGGCFSTPNEIVLCFSSLETDQCRRGTDPLGEFETISNSVYQHSYIRLSASEGNNDRTNYYSETKTNLKSSRFQDLTLVF